MRWYVSQHGKTTGPFDEERLAMMVRWGKVSREAFICDPQCSAWIAIKRSAFAPLLPARDSEPEHRLRPAASLARVLLGVFAACVLLAGVLMAAT
jgi:hypothetical protein